MITHKNIVLTGCNSGIGLEILKLLIKGDNRILCVDTDSDNLKKIESDKIIIVEKDISSFYAIDEIFEEAVKNFGKIDIFFANAGFAYYEEINYENWDRISRIFETNVFSPIYSYQKYIKHLNGNKGTFVITCSVIGLLAIPGYSLYSATKFALSGFSRAIKYEKPNNMRLCCIYPVATDTGFFKRANKIDFRKPFPLQSPEEVAKKALTGVEKGKTVINTSTLFSLSKPIMRLCPPIKLLYLHFENKKFTEFRKKLRRMYPDADSLS